MGKASKFFKSLFGFKPSEPTDAQPFLSDLNNKQPKRRWSFIKSQRDKRHHHLSDSLDPSLSRPLQTPLHHHSSDQTTRDQVDAVNTGSSNYAIAFAAATAAVAEAAFAAEVVRMANRTAGYGIRGDWAAVKIQSYFRAYLARKALRALKALVRLQALVRGHLQRKQAADDLQRLQALLRLQKRVRATRFQNSDSPQSITKAPSHTHHNGPSTPEISEHVLRTRRHNQSLIPKNHGSRSCVRFMTRPTDDEKMLKVDNAKPHRRRTLFQSDQISYSYSHSHSHSLSNSGGSTIQPPECYEVNSLSTPIKRKAYEDVSLCPAQNTSLRVTPFTPAKSDSSRSCLSGYSDHPNYMAYTQSSRAKVRSVSAPRQRLQFEFPSGTKRYSVYGYGSGMQRGSNLRDSFASKAYPGSGRLDRMGMPVGGIIGFRECEYSGGMWN